MAKIYPMYQRHIPRCTDDVPGVPETHTTMYPVLGIKCSKKIWLGLILYRAPCAIKEVLSLDLSKVTITLKAKALDLSLGSTLFSQDPKSSHDDESKPSSDNGKKVDEDPRKESECVSLNYIKSNKNVIGLRKSN
ncbi:hypothetical protein Tco_0928662 [Tanacetum coccineum]